MFTKNIVFLASFAVLAAFANGLENPYWRYVKDSPMPYRTYYGYPLKMEMPRYTYYSTFGYPELVSMKPATSIQLPLTYPYGLASYPLRYAYPYASYRYASPALLKEEDKGASGYIIRYPDVVAPTVTPMSSTVSEVSTAAPEKESSSALPAPIIAERSPAIAFPREKLQDEIVGPSGYIATFSEIKK